MAGFISGDGSFYIKIDKGRNKTGVGFQLGFKITQHIRDEALLKSFISYFKCGYYIKPLQEEWGNYKCTKFSDNYNIIIPFFTQYPVRGVKAKDFIDLVKAAEIKNKINHLTIEWSSKII
jgi:hypothetical protein